MARLTGKAVTPDRARQIRRTKAIAKAGTFEEVHSRAEQAELVLGLAERLTMGDIRYVIERLA